MQPFDYLNTSVKSYLRPSKIHGVGLFALVDIKKGEQVFPLWEGKTNFYTIKFSEAKKLPKEVLAYILRSYTSFIENDDSVINFRLVKNTNFLFAEPISFINTAFEQANLDMNGFALRDINKDEELLGNYGNSSQVKLL